MQETTLPHYLETVLTREKICTAGDFDKINTVGGFCYTFNKQNVHVAKGTGVRQGLRLQLSPDDQEFSLGKDQGFRIVIHNPDELPRPESEGIVVGLSSTIYIGMRQVNSIDETQFSSRTRCKKETNPDQELSIAGYATYSPSLCQEECFYNEALSCKTPGELALKLVQCDGANLALARHLE